MQSNTLTPTTTDGTKNKPSPLKQSLKFTIPLAALLLCSIGFSIFEIIQNNINHSKIKELEAQLENNGSTAQETTSDSVPNSNDTPSETDPSTTDYSLFINKGQNSQNQRYELVYTGDLHTASNNLTSEDDEYYILDTQKLGTANDLRKFDLVSVLKPLTNQKIQNLPEYAVYDLHSKEDKLYASQCGSFSVEYNNGHEYLLLTLGMDLNIDIPIAVNYYCHYKDEPATQRLYHRTVYVLNAESGEIKELEGSATSDFTNR